MGEKIYEVVYLDSFGCEEDASEARAKLKACFHLNDSQLKLLCSGVPVVVKKNLPLAEAQRFESAIKQAGATCWLQEMSPDEVHYERRQNKRRLLLDRRATYRGSSILPDRRSNTGRRREDRP
jgi:hypothetical protein